jgi:serine/threonine protein kinase
MISQTKYTPITILQSSVTEQSMMVDCPSQQGKTAILQSYATNQANDLTPSSSSQIEKLISLQHENLQTVIDVFIEDNSLHVLTMAVQGKQSATQVPLSEDRCEKLLKEILPVLAYLHSQGVTHGNISPHSILMDKQNKPTLTDFHSLAELIIMAGGDICKPIINQLREIPVANIPNGNQFDLYSLGVTAIYLISNRELKHLYDQGTQQWQWNNYLSPSNGKLLRAINKLIGNQPTSATEVLQELQPLSRVITDHPILTQEFSSDSQQMPQSPSLDRQDLFANPQPTNFPPVLKSKNDWTKAVMIGGLFSGTLLLGLLLGNSFQQKSSNNPPLASPLSQPTEATQAPSPQVSSSPKNIMLGNWSGRYAINDTTSTLKITEQIGNSFAGQIITGGKRGGQFRLSIAGNINLRGKTISFRETSLVERPVGEKWFLGENTGILSDDLKTISGNGLDTKGNRYSWNLSKN